MIRIDNGILGMSQRVKALVKPNILIWARETVGLDLDNAAKKLGTSVARITAWEDEGTKDSPTIKQLQKIARVYKRPLSVFYLQDIPHTFQILRDFRRLADSELQHYSPELMLEQRLANQRREQALECADNLGIKPDAFQFWANLDEDPEIVAARIRQYLRVPFEKQIGWSSMRIAFNAWRRKVEELGVLVFQMTRVPSNEASGFAISHEIYPVIALNRNNTSFTRRSLTLFHEFAHLMLRQSGISEIDIDFVPSTETQRVELWCSAVAIATLMPCEQLLEDEVVRKRRGDNWLDSHIENLAKKFGVSREVAVRRLLRFNLVSDAFYQTKRYQYANEWKESRYQKILSRDVLSDLGRPFVRLVLNAFYNELITLSDVSSYLGIRVCYVPKIERELGFE